MSASNRASGDPGQVGRRTTPDQPEKINRYTVKRLLGKGGQGAVYHAYDPNLAIDVALKVLHPDFRSEEFIDRIRAEARISVRLTAPNVVRVYDFDEQYPYIVMEYCGDGDLNRYLKTRKRRSLTETLSIMRQICEALIAAHEHDPPILHRDLKPGNVLFQKQTPKVADFGLAKMLGGGTGLTTTRGVMGTVRYCSPEQLRDASKVDTRTDIWAAGVVLYELLTWVRPFDKPGDSFVSVAVRVHTEPPRQPPYEIPAPVMAVILKAIEKEVDKRFHSAREMRDALDQALREIPDADSLLLPPESVVDDSSQKAARVADFLEGGRSNDAATLVQEMRREAPDDSLGVYWQRRVKEVSSKGGPSSGGSAGSGEDAKSDLARQLGSVQSLIQNRAYREARQRIGELLIQAPDNSAVQNLLEKITRDEARLRQDLDQAHADADQARSASDYTRLCEVWKTLNDKYPDLPEAQAEFAVATREMEILEQSKSREAVAAEAAALRDAGDLRGSLAAWQAHTTRFAADQEALREQQQIRDALTQRERAEYLARVKSEAAQLRAAGNLEGALALWEGYLRDDPSSSEAEHEAVDLKTAIALKEGERRLGETRATADARAAAGDRSGALAAWESYLADYSEDSEAAAIAGRLRQGLAEEERQTALGELQSQSAVVQTRLDGGRYRSATEVRKAIDGALGEAHKAASGDAGVLVDARTRLAAALGQAETALTGHIATRRQELQNKVEELRDWLPRDPDAATSAGTPGEQALDRALAAALDALCAVRGPDAPGDPIEPLATAGTHLSTAGEALEGERQQALSEADALARSAVGEARVAVEALVAAAGDDRENDAVVRPLTERLGGLQEKSGSRVPERLAGVARQAGVLRSEAEAVRATILWRLQSEIGVLLDQGMGLILDGPDDRLQELLRGASRALHPEPGQQQPPVGGLVGRRGELRAALQSARAAREEGLNRARERWERALRSWRELLTGDLASVLGEEGEKAAASGQLALAEAKCDELDGWAIQLEDLARRYHIESAWIEQSDTVLQIEGPLGPDGLPLADLDPRFRKLMARYRKAAADGDGAEIRAVGPQLKELAGSRPGGGSRRIEVELQAAPLKGGARRLNERYAPAPLHDFDELVSRYQKARSQKRVGEAARLAAELNAAYRRVLQPPPVWRRPWLPAAAAALLMAVGAYWALVPPAPNASVTLVSPGGVLEITGVTRNGGPGPDLAQRVSEEGVTWRDLEPGHYVVSVSGGDTREFDIPGAGVVMLPAGESDYSQTLLRELGLSGDASGE